jgi:Uma2 family endonuclease
MLKYLEPLDWLPTAEDLPCSDETPVDSEIQESLPNLLKFILATIFADRTDWFFAIDMGLYYNPEVPPVVPDAFLSLGVDHVKPDQDNLRPSYVLWEEKGIVPQFVLEVVSQNYRGEYRVKKDLYEGLGVLYYIVYNPLRKRKPSLEVYRLMNGRYLPVIGSPVWMPEIGLGIGKERYQHHGVNREWLFWYDEQGNRYPTPQELTIQARKLALQAQEESEQAQTQLQSEQARSQRLANRLRELGINPDEI